MIHVVVAQVELDRAPERDSSTLLLLPFDEPDEAIRLDDKLVVDPIYLRMEAKYREGRFGGALEFNGRPGLRQCVLIPIPQSLHRIKDSSRKDPTRFAELDVPTVLTDNERGYTVEFWVYPKALQRQTILAGINSAAFVADAPWKIGLTENGNLYFSCGAGLHRFSILSQLPVPVGEWSHVAVVNRGGRVRLLLNGELAGDEKEMEMAALQRTSQPGSDGTVLCIGGPGPDREEDFFDGLIDELRLSLVPRTFRSDPAVYISNRKELFLDDQLVGVFKGTQRVVNQPQRHKGNPLLVPKGDWEARCLQPFGTVYDPRTGLFRTWYRAFNSADTEANMCYAFSRDGLHWEQPELGLAEYQGSTANNIIAARRSSFFFLDPLARPGEGNICATAKMRYGSKGGTFKQVLIRSSDGISWSWGEVESRSGYQGWPYNRIRRIEAVMATDRPLITDPTYFAKIDKLVIIDKEGEDDHLKFRQFARVGWDLTHWQDPYLTDLLSTEKNNMGWYGIKTHDEGSVIVGITDAYHGNRPGGWIDFQLVSSRDGYHWQHVADQATFFPVGEEGTWDAGMVLYAQVVEPPHSEELYIYYEGSRVRHNGDHTTSELFPLYNMGVAFLRKDGYVSVERDGSTAIGVVDTSPIRFKGRHLYVNADASRGSISVEICDETGNPIPGFEKTQARQLDSDSLRHRVSWAQRSNVEELSGQAVVLRFWLSGEAKLYSYRFDNVGLHG